MTLTLDINAVRAEFPIFAREVYGKPLVYLDNAASAQKPRAVIDAMKGAMEGSYANVHRGLHLLANETTAAFEAARKTVAAFLNAASLEEIVFTAGGTDAINLVANSLGPLVDGMEYVRWAMQRGLDVDEFAPRLSFFINAHNDFFEEIAKYRAARRIWGREMRHTFGAKDDRSWLMRFHTQTAGVSLTAQQPENNIVRVAIQALAAVLGGTHSLHTNSMDEALALPSEHAVTIALRTQQMLAEESGVANTVDPLGGSFFVESLTNRLEAQAYDYFRKYEPDYWLTCYKDAIEELNSTLSKPANLFVHREAYVAGYYANENITIREMRGNVVQIQSGDFILVNTRTNEDRRILKDIPPVIQSGRGGALFCTIGRVP